MARSKGKVKAPARRSYSPVSAHHRQGWAVGSSGTKRVDLRLARFQTPRTRPRKTREGAHGPLARQDNTLSKAKNCPALGLHLTATDARSLPSV